MSIQSNINQGLFLGTAALGAINNIAKEDTSLAKEQFNAERESAQKQAKYLGELSKDLEKDESEYLAENVSSNVLGGLTEDDERRLSKYSGILGEKKKQKKYLWGAGVEEYNQQIYQAANRRVEDILALKEEQMKYSKLTDGLYDKVSDETKAEIRKQLGGKK